MGVFCDRLMCFVLQQPWTEELAITQVDIAEMMTKRNGILSLMNQLDPCNKHFLLPNIQVVKMNSINSQSVTENFADICDEEFEGPDGVLSIIDWVSAPDWIEKYMNHIQEVEKTVFDGTTVDEMNSEQGEIMRTYQERFKVDLTVQDVLDMSYGKFEKEGDTYTFRKVETFSDYIAITMTTPVHLYHFRKVDRNEDDVTKKYRVHDGYRHGETRLYLEPRPIRYGIKGKTNSPAFIYDAPKTSEEAQGTRKHQRIKSYMLYGLIVSPVEESDTGSGHFECFVRTQEKNRNNEVWRHFDDDQEIKEYPGKDLPNLDKYTIVAVFMKDVSPSKKLR